MTSLFAASFFLVSACSSSSQGDPTQDSDAADTDPGDASEPDAQDSGREDATPPPMDATPGDTDALSDPGHDPTPPDDARADAGETGDDGGPADSGDVTTEDDADVDVRPDGSEIPGDVSDDAEPIDPGDGELVLPLVVDGTVAGVGDLSGRPTFLRPTEQCLDVAGDVPFAIHAIRNPSDTFALRVDVDAEWTFRGVLFHWDGIDEDTPRDGGCRSGDLGHVISRSSHLYRLEVPPGETLHLVAAGQSAAEWGPYTLRATTRVVDSRMEVATHDVFSEGIDSLVLSGPLEASPVWTQINGCDQELFTSPYRLHRVDNGLDRTLAWTFRVTSAYDAMVYVYDRHPFPRAPFAGCITGAQRIFLEQNLNPAMVDMPVPAGASRWIVVGTWDGDIGDYETRIDARLLLEETAVTLTPGFGTWERASSFTDETPRGPRTTPFCNLSSTPVPRRPLRIENPGEEPLRVAVEAEWSFDGFLMWQEDPWAPDAPHTTCLAANDDYGGRRGSRLEEVVVPSGGATMVVAAGATDSARGNWRIRIEELAP